MNTAACISALDKFAEKRVMVIGDLMLDEHIWGTAERISPEAPVMVVQVDSPQDFLPGGAANVANNIRALGAGASVVGVVGDDESGEILRSRLKERGVDVSGIFIDKTRPTTRKTRIWASHRHQVVRVDWESRRGIDPDVLERIVHYLQESADSADAVLISDYSKGMITQETAQAAIRTAHLRGCASACNAKPAGARYCRGVGVMTMNQSEASAVSGIGIEDTSDVEEAGKVLLRETGCRNLVITRGSRGLSVFEGTGHIRHIPAVQSEVYDVAGAGDTVIGALTLACSSGLDLPSSSAVANCAAGAVVRKVGVATTSIGEIAAILKANG
jgi:D-beta-D-heptose 7-phosphate kinase/D-beta-D-heptose 1-phosphate adenosyltransferase